MTATRNTADANRQLVIDYFREVVASFNAGALSKYLSPDFVMHGPDALAGIDNFEAILHRDFGDHPPLDPETAQMLPPVFVISGEDLVTICFYMPAVEPDDASSTYDVFAFNTYRIEDGMIVERWTNEHKYARPQLPDEPAMGRERSTEPRYASDTDVEANKQLVSSFYAEVFGLMNPAAVQEFVADDYLQHASHMPQGRVGLEAFVANLAAHAPPPPSRTTAPSPPPSPAVLHAEGDMVVIAGALPQPLRDGSGATWTYYAYDAYRIRDGKLVEHWSGIDKHARPEHP